MQGESVGAALRLELVADRVIATQPKRQRSSKRITMHQAKNVMEAVAFAKSIGLPLVAHCTIHWSLTDAGDDPDGKLFANVREGLNKWLGRRDIAFAGVWARERQSSGQSDVVHCHLLFYLPVDYRSGKKLRQVVNEINQLLELHDRGIQHEKAVDLRVHADPDGKYLIKGGGKKVWDRFHVRKEDRGLQGVIYGKRCGTTENIGPTARKRWESQQDKKEGVREPRCLLRLSERAEGRLLNLRTPPTGLTAFVRSPTLLA